MSSNGQPSAVDDAAVVVADFPLLRGAGFNWHRHESHQLAWSAAGVLVVEAAGRSYVLPPSRALFIPSHVDHRVVASGTALMRALYLQPGSCPLQWRRPTAVAVTPLTAELVGYLDTAPPPAARSRAEAVLYDLLVAVDVATIEVPIPADARAREVAERLVADPRDSRSLAVWGREVGASERTLARLFVAETGLTFARWRTGARLRAALPLLAAGRTVTAVAAEVGYGTASAFVAAFRSHTGTTPGTFSRTVSRGRTPGRWRSPGPPARDRRRR